MVSNTAEAVNLDDMPYAFGAGYSQEKGCLPGTRESLIRDICDILNNPIEDAPRVCLLTGAAGSGKSTVAHSIAGLYDGQMRLGSSYFFNLSDVMRRDPRNFFSTIARDLSDHDPQFRSALWEVVQFNRAVRTSTSPLEQVERLIIEPSNHLHSVGPLVIVVDALDESGDLFGRRRFLPLFSAQITQDKLPANLRFFITARPESDVLAAFPPGPQIVRKNLDVIPVSIVNEDIGKLIDHSLSQYSELESYWPHREWCQLLILHSRCLFLWASVACEFISGGLDVRERLETLLRVDGTASTLDSMYESILGQLLPSPNSVHQFQNVMAIVLLLKEPLPLASLSALFGRVLDVRSILKPMGSLLVGVTDEKTPIRPLHPSFSDFLKDRSSTFHIDILPRHSLTVGRALLACMQEMLKFNICDLRDARVLNTAIPNLPSRVNKAIPPHVAYSCQYWMDHMQDADCSAELLDEVTSFFKDTFPFWLEAISLLSLSSPVCYILASLQTCTILKEWAKVGLTMVMNAECGMLNIKLLGP